MREHLGGHTLLFDLTLVQKDQVRGDFAGNGPALLLAATRTANEADHIARKGLQGHALEQLVP